MVSYVAKRIAMAFLTVYVVISISFYMVRMMPGNAMQALQAQLGAQGGMTPQQIQQRVNAIYGVMPNGPLWRQYLDYVGNAFQGNFGRSITDPGQTVLGIIAGALPWTIFVVAVALLVSFVIGVVVGTFIATFQDSRLAKVGTAVVSVLSAIPNYLVAIVLLYFLTDEHTFFPLGGAYSGNTKVGLNLPFLVSALYHAALPIIASVIVAFGGWALAMKGSVATVLGADYVRAASSWGLPRWRVTQSYIGRNSLLPMVTNLALSVGYLFGGSVFIETYFTYPGIGYYLVQAVNARDYSLMMGCFILITIAVVVANLVVDLCYPLIDPRIVSPLAVHKARSKAKAEIPEPRGLAAGKVA